MTQWFKHPEQPNTWISKDEYFAILFGDEYMASEDKGTIKEY
jgi:hypothetical protein